MSIAFGSYGDEDRILAGDAADRFRPACFVNRLGNCRSMSRSCLQHDQIPGDRNILEELADDSAYCFFGGSRGFQFREGIDASCFCQA
jgi:hypothetical protein